LMLMALAPTIPPLDAQPAAQARITGTLTALQVDHLDDRLSAGRIVIGTQAVIVPPSVAIEFPGVSMPLQALFTPAPAPTTARVSAAPDGHGNLVAAKVAFTRNDSAVSGAVTFVSPDEGYIRINGALGIDAGGAMVRINDPEARQSVQVGRGCGEEG